MASNIRVMRTPPKIAVLDDVDPLDTIDRRSSRRPLELFEDGHSSELAWELAPDGVASLGGDRSPDLDFSGEVHVRRRPVRLELVRDGSGQAVPRLTSTCRTVEIRHDGLRVTERREERCVPWTEVRHSVSTMDFVEDEVVADDARTVGTVERSSWFRRRRSLPVVRYGAVRVTGADDLRAVWLFSNIEAASSLAAVLTASGAHAV